jgi:hypothetical protein
MHPFIKLLFGLLLFSACSKEQITPTASDYFIGSWQFRSGVQSPSPIPKVTFEKSGKVTFNLGIVTDPTSSPIISGTWSYQEKTRELTFETQQSSHKVIEQLPNQFITDKGIIFVRE